MDLAQAKHEISNALMFYQALARLKDTLDAVDLADGQITEAETKRLSVQAAIDQLGVERTQVEQSLSQYRAEVDKEIVRLGAEKEAALADLGVKKHDLEVAQASFDTFEIGAAEQMAHLTAEIEAKKTEYQQIFDALTALRDQLPERK